MHRAYILCIIGAVIFITSFLLSSEYTRVLYSIHTGYRADMYPTSLPEGFDLVMWIVSIVGMGVLIWGLAILWMERSPYRRWFP
jgi:hypothetical protein